MYADILESGTKLLTLKDGANLPPGCDASLASVLAQRCLQEEDRNATGKEEDEVGDEKGTCGWEKGFPLPGTSLLIVHIHLLPLPPHTASQNPQGCGTCKTVGDISPDIWNHSTDQGSPSYLTSPFFHSESFNLYLPRFAPHRTSIITSIIHNCGNSKELIE